MNYRAAFNGLYVMIDSSLKDENEIINKAFDLVENDDTNICDVDVLWHGLHFLLTDVVDFEDSENILSGAIFGFEVLEDSDELFCSITSPENLESLVDKLGDIETEEILKKFNKESFLENEITPIKLYKKEDEEFLYDDLFVCLEQLIEFYYSALEQGKSVVCLMGNFE